MARFTHPAFGDVGGLTTEVKSYTSIWSGTGLAYSNNPVTASYVKIGNMVTAQINVSFANVTNFGTGQYSLTLPFPSKYHTDVFGGSVHNILPSVTNHYSLKAHLAAGSSTITLWDISGSGKDEPFDFNSPFVIRTSELFHMLLTYICE